MLQLTAHMQILVAIAPVDFRGGIDRLCRICQTVLASDPFSGAVFVFRNRRGTAIKVLAYDGQGFWLCMKRLSENRFRYWPSEGGRPEHELLAHELSVLLMGGDPGATQATPLFRPLRRAEIRKTG